MVKPTILVVDDEDDLRDLVRDVLESRGFTVLDAASGDAALKILEGDFLRIDLLFTDVRMPGNLNGFALAERAKAIRLISPSSSRRGSRSPKSRKRSPRSSRFFASHSVSATCL